MKHVTKTYQKLWWEKFYSLFVSGKIIFFFTILTVGTICLFLNKIDGEMFIKLQEVNIITIAGMRGAVEIAQITKKQKHRFLNGPNAANTLEEEPNGEQC